MLGKFVNMWQNQVLLIRTPGIFFLSDTQSIVGWLHEYGTCGYRRAHCIYQDVQLSPLNSRTFLSPQEEIPQAHQQSLCIALLPLTTSTLLLVSMNLLIMNISYRWHQTVCGLLWLASFMSHFQGSSVLYTHHFHSFLHFIYLFISWWLLWDTVNKAATLNIHAQFFVWMCIFISLG